MFELSSETISKKISPKISNRTSAYQYRQKLLEKNDFFSQQVYQNETIQEIVENGSHYQIASLIPDEVILNSSNYKMRKFEAVVFFADVSGFTDLCERYQNLENGASKLSAVLNFYLGIMVQEILSHNGDIIKYAGDAFLAIFRNESWMSMQSSIHNAVDTAIIIQRNCQNFRTEIGITLNVKIAISCGEVDFQIIGDESSSHYIIIGDPVWQVKSLQEFISPGEILLTWKAWYYTQESLYTYQMLREQRCYKITGFKEQMTLIRRQYEANLNFQEMHKNLSKSIENKSASNIFLDSDFTAQNKIFSLRKNISSATSYETRNNLRRFIIKPLLNAINMGDNIDSMTEMRSVVIVFLNFIVLYKESKDIMTITDRIYKKLYSIVNSYEGVLNKVSLFDKDMMFLNIFGLKGLQHDNDSEIGLKCARELYETFKLWDEISVVSIGVTTGKSYCGIVGHSLRREYSVISVAVNRAARLMIAYPNIVSCDQEVMINSKINLRHFRLLPKKSLKGISESLAAYEFFQVTDSVKIISDWNENEILYGRDEMIIEISKIIANAIDIYNSRKQHDSFVSCIIVKGESGEGKGSIINYLLSKILKQNIKCLKLLPNTKHSSIPFWMLKSIFTKLIDTEYDSKKEFQDSTEKLFQNLNIHKFLYLVNEIIDTKFDENSDEINHLNGEQKIEIQKLIIKILCKNLKNFWMIFIDDADYIDLYSLKFINSIMSTHMVFFMLAIGNNHKKWTLQLGKFIKSQHVTQYNLKPIDKTFHKHIACQSLNVAAIPIEFERFLHKNSNGNPGWIETCAKTLLYSGKLKIKTLTPLHAINNGMIIGNQTTNYDDHEDFFYMKSINNQLREDDEKMIKVAVIDGVLSEKDYNVPYKNNKLMMYDTLSSYDQMICKCASVIGYKFTRLQLNALIEKIDYRLTGKTIAKLFQFNILFCTSKRSQSEAYYCGCKDIEIFESCRDLPKYSNCAHMTFNDEMFRKHVYDTLTEKQRIEYHRKCIKFLCRNTKKCSSCNYGRFESIEEIKLNFVDGYVKDDCKKFEARKRVIRNVFSLGKNQCNDISMKHPIVLNYMSYGFRNCVCKFLLYHTFNDIVRHCQGKDANIKKIFSQITSADLSIQTGNISNAIRYLNLSIELLHTISNFKQNEDDLILTYLYGKALTLQGFCRETMGQNSEALTFYYSACATFKINFPRKLNLCARFMKHKLNIKIIKLLNQSKRPACTRLKVLIIRQSSELLQNMHHNFMLSNSFQLAKLAALWSLKDALASNTEISSLATCFRNALNSGMKLYFISIERVIFNEMFKSNLCQNLDKISLKNIIDLYITVMEHEIFQENIQFALKIGDFTKKMCYNIGSHEALLRVIPSLFIINMRSYRIDECYKLLQELKYSIKFNNNVDNARIWYYALSMDLCLFLNTKVDCFIEYDSCERIFYETISTQVYTNASLRFVTNFMLWSIQKGQRSYLHVRNFLYIEKFFSKNTFNFNQAYTASRILKLLRIHLNHARVSKNFEYYDRLDKFIKKNFEKLK